MLGAGYGNVAVTTLYAKADDDAFLAALLRVIEGQVRAAMVDHKEWNLPEKAARSIAKRVCGDVAANWSRLDAVREAAIRTA